MALYLIFNFVFRRKMAARIRQSSGEPTERVMSGHLKCFTKTCWLYIGSNMVYGSFALGLSIWYSPWVYLKKGREVGVGFGVCWGYFVNGFGMDLG